ncbi:SUMF1/EgtB/PvdO family nonheme iron enzyme [Myxococcota bacterium]
MTLDGQGISGTVLAVVASGRTSTRIEVCLPPTLGPGAFELSVANQSGSTCGNFQLVQGEQGEPGEGNGYTAGPGIIIVSGEISADVGSSAGQVASGNELAALQVTVASLETTVAAQQAEIDSLNNRSCPSGYTHDTSRTDIVLCTRGSDEMVKVGDFWIDRYEASIWANADCTGTPAPYGTTHDDYPGTFPNTGNIENASDRLYACSKRGVLPSRHMTSFQAAQACLASGKHLTTNAEWQAAAVGTHDPGANDGTANSLCNTDASSVRVTGSAGSVPAGVGSCVSFYGAEDMIGNVWGATATWFVTGRPWQPSDAEQRRLPWPPAYGDDATWHVNGRALDGIYVEGAPAITIRGGDIYTGTDSGVFGISMRNAASSSSGVRGFRCARSN